MTHFEDMIYPVANDVLLFEAQNYITKLMEEK